MSNPYLPLPMIVRERTAETIDGSIITLSLSFLRGEDADGFEFLPGQFSELSLLGTGEAPFGIASSPLEGQRLDFTVSRAGTVTSGLHRLEPGDKVGMRGPFGNGYPLDELSGGGILVIGGGFGFSTLRAFTLFALHPGNRSRFDEITVVYGARNPGMLLYEHDLREWGSRDDLNLYVTVDDGDAEWNGMTGLVPDAVRALKIRGNRTKALVCGPPGMMRHTLPVLGELGISEDRIYLSLEMKMKCGIGKCGRCNIGSMYVCTDGPVFSLADLNRLTGEY